MRFCLFAEKNSRTILLRQTITDKLQINCKSNVNYMSYQSSAPLTMNEHHLMRRALNILITSFSTMSYQICISININYVYVLINNREKCREYSVLTVRYTFERHKIINCGICERHGYNKKYFAL